MAGIEEGQRMKKMRVVLRGKDGKESARARAEAFTTAQYSPSP